MIGIESPGLELLLEKIIYLNECDQNQKPIQLGIKSIIYIILRNKSFYSSRSFKYACSRNRII